MSFHSDTKTKARKHHTCGMCGRTIPKGTTYLRQAGVYDGDFYSNKAHEDCAEMWQRVYHDFCYDEGMPWDFKEVLQDGFSAEEAQESLDDYRGYFPHVVCRLEFRLEKWLAEARP